MGRREEDVRKNKEGPRISRISYENKWSDLLSNITTSKVPLTMAEHDEENALMPSAETAAEAAAAKSATTTRPGIRRSDREGDLRSVLLVSAYLIDPLSNTMTEVSTDEALEKGRSDEEKGTRRCSYWIDAEIQGDLDDAFVETLGLL